MTVVLDSAFLADVRGGEPKALALLSQLVVDRESALVPSVVAAEYLAGSRDAEADLAALEAASVIQDFRLDDARAAAELARRLFLRGKFPGWVDVVVGGFAKARGNLPIVTRNTRHFPQNRTRSY